MRDVPRRSVLAAGAAAASAGVGMAALSGCSSNEGADSTASELASSIARALQRNPLNGKLLFHDNFDHGFDGWRDHYNAMGPAPALSLTSYPVVSGSHALMIGCSAAPDSGYTAGWASGSNSAAIKNLSRYFDSHLVTFSCYLAHGTNDSTASLGGYWLMIDTQFWDDSHRSFYKLMINRNASTGNRSLSIADNGGKMISVESHGADLFSGDNQNKFNFDWISLTVDLSANRGSGGYHSCQVNNRVFDLTPLAGQSATTDPQAGNAMESFAGGLNFGVLVYPGQPGTGESFVVIDQAVVTVDETA